MCEHVHLLRVHNNRPLGLKTPLSHNTYYTVYDTQPNDHPMTVILHFNVNPGQMKLKYHI